MNTHFTGVAVHEWLGAALGVALSCHMMLHWKWIASVTKRLFKMLPTVQRVHYFIDLALFINSDNRFLTSRSYYRNMLALPWVAVETIQRVNLF